MRIFVAGLALGLAALAGSSVPARSIACDHGPYIVFFSKDAAYISMEAREVLDSWTQAIGDCGPARTMIAGHTDLGETDDLGDTRIRTVRAYLVAHGIPAEEISSQNLGQSMPRIPSDEGGNHSENRRVEISRIYPPLPSES